MICLRLLALSLCLQLGWACAPVQPGEDMPCPSVPQAQTAPGYVTTPLSGPTTVNGAKVYSCADAAYTLLSVDGANPPMELAIGATISCKPNSGIFVTDDGKAVGSKKFICGQLEVLCPTPKEATTITNVVVEPLEMEPNANGDKIWKCTPPLKLYSVMMDDPDQGMELLGDDAVVTCVKQSGKLTYKDGTDVAATTSFACGILPCQTCDTNVFTDENNPACDPQTDIFCDSGPVIGKDAAGCPTVTCASGALFLMTGITTSEPVTAPSMIKCDPVSGKFKYIDGKTDLPQGGVGFVCANVANCNMCDGLVTGTTLYTGIDATALEILGTRDIAKPTCTYGCGADSTMIVGGVSHETAVCQMDTSVVTVDGQTLSANNKFGCPKCKCLKTALGVGEIALCPKGKLCGMPAPKGLCMAECPAQSTPIYFDAMGMRKTSATIMCVDNVDWIEAGSMGDVTCEYADGQGYTMTPPTCDAVGTLTCTAPMVCDPMQLVYSKSGDDTVLSCKSGTLITNTNGIEQSSVTCGIGGGPWLPALATANCVTDKDTAVGKCLNMMDPTVSNVLTSTCAFGVCYLSCPANQQFEYPMGGATEKNADIKCVYGEELNTIALMPIEMPLMIKCVPL